MGLVGGGVLFAEFGEELGVEDVEAFLVLDDEVLEESEEV